MNTEEKLKLLKSKFIMVCTNRLPAGEPYKHPDLYALSKKAIKRGEKYFCFESYKKDGMIKFREGKPKYQYKFGLKEFLTEEEYNDIFKGIKQ